MNEDSEIIRYSDRKARKEFFPALIPKVGDPVLVIPFLMHIL